MYIPHHNVFAYSIRPAVCLDRCRDVVQSANNRPAEAAPWNAYRGLYILSKASGLSLTYYYHMDGSKEAETVKRPTLTEDYAHGDDGSYWRRLLHKYYTR